MSKGKKKGKKVGAVETVGATKSKSKGKSSSGKSKRKGSKKVKVGARTKRVILHIGATPGEGGRSSGMVGEVLALGAGIIGGSMAYAMADGARSKAEGQGIMGNELFPVAASVGIGALAMLAGRQSKSKAAVLFGLGVAGGGASQEVMRRWGAWGVQMGVRAMDQSGSGGQKTAGVGATIMRSNPEAMAPILDVINSLPEPGPETGAVDMVGAFDFQPAETPPDLGAFSLDNSKTVMMPAT